MNKNQLLRALAPFEDEIPIDIDERINFYFYLDLDKGSKIIITTEKMSGKNIIPFNPEKF